MTIRQLEVFLAVAKYKNFSEAANKLFFSQPTISMHISSLEEELGVNLIIRDTKKVEITSQGEKLIPLAKKLLDVRSQIERDISENETGGNKIIKISASSIPSEFILPNVLSLFKKTYPKIEFSIKQSTSSGVFNDIIEKNADIGFLGSSFRRKAVLYIPFYDDELVIITPKTLKYEKMEGKFDLSVLINTPIITREKGSGTWIEVEKKLKKLKIDTSMLKIVANYSSWDAIIKSVIEGMGITIASKSIVDNKLIENKVLIFPLSAKKETRQLYISYLSKRRLTVNERLLVQFVRDFYK